MTRPTMVRADTLDLQEKGNPSAQDHSKSALNHFEPGDSIVGPHQAQEIRHINQERHEEEENLQHAWTAAHQGGPDPLAPDGVTNDEGAKGAEDADSASDDDMMDRISSSPSIDDEDIDFDFVYALHTFVATVEGQANATKGDTMVLLDDTNSYWWLVRVVKDSSIGYLPAEHIETPTERLARLNKHRNVDLSAAMLGDSTEKSKNPLKKAMKRRATKTVQFAAPTYVEASDYDDSDQEQDPTVEPAAEVNKAGQTATTNEDDSIEDGTIDSIGSPASSNGSLAESSNTQADKAEAAPLKSRKGTTRNADSFLKDDSAETRKFTLTPNLLREDTARASSAVESSRGQVSPALSSDTFGSNDSPKAKKEKKQRTLSGLFKSSKKKEKEKEREKSKDRSRKKEVAYDGDAERASVDTARSGSTTMSIDSPKGKEADKKAALKNRKLQKQQTVSLVPPESPLQEAGEEHERDPAQGEEPQGQGPTAFVAELEGSQVAYEAPTGLEDEIVAAVAVASRETPPLKVKHGEQRAAVNGSDEAFAGDEDGHGGSFMHGTEAVHIPLQVGEFEDSTDEEPDLEDGDEQVELTEGVTSRSVLEKHDTSREHQGNASGLDESGVAQRTGSAADPTDERGPAPPVEPSTEPVQRGGHGGNSPVASRSVASSGSPALTNASTAAWSDAGLRAWLDGDNDDTHDMLTIIYDTTGVRPAGADHPWMAGYLGEEKGRVASMMAELDALHNDFLRRKGKQVAPLAVAVAGA